MPKREGDFEENIILFNSHDTGVVAPNIMKNNYLVVYYIEQHPLPGGVGTPDQGTP